VIRFMLAGTQRTGTTLLRTTLDSHPDICSYGEIFLFRKGRGGQMAGGYRRYLNEDRLKRMTRHYLAQKGMIGEFLDQLGTNSGARAVGFKLMLGQASAFPAVPEYVRSYDYRIIQVLRRNALKTLLSRTALLKRGVAHTREKVSASKIQIPTGQLVQRLDSIIQESRWAEQAFSSLPLMTVWYEDFVASKQEQLSRVLDFLDTPSREGIESSLVKLNPDTLSDVIENYEEVVTVLKGTQHEQLV
jgi:hypothetical protein